MSDSRFFRNNGPISLQQVLDLTGARLLAESDVNLRIHDVAPLETANEKEISFFINNKYIESFKSSKAGFCFCAEKFVKIAPASMITLIHDNPYKAYAIIAAKFYPSEDSNNIVSQTSIISKNAKIGINCQIGNFVTIEDNVQIGNNCIIDHNTVIKKNVIIGNNTRVASNVTISHSIIGNNVTIHPGAKIGQDGFGFASDHTGHLNVAQLGFV
ncbi:MAG: LpxD N-terminal domain-containing protein [Pseudomonadota bacterium]